MSKKTITVEFEDGEKDGHQMQFYSPCDRTIEFVKPCYSPSWYFPQTQVVERYDWTGHTYGQGTKAGPRYIYRLRKEKKRA